MRPRDIDYAATAVRKSIVEKFGRDRPLESLVVTANERTITVQDGAHIAEGTRDDLLAGVRKAGDYDALWQELPAAKQPAG